MNQASCPAVIKNDFSLALSRSKNRIIEYAQDASIDPGEIVWGRQGFGGRAKDTFFAWGIAPSALAHKTMAAIISLYVDQKPNPPSIFYTCYAGTHTSIFASALHVGNVIANEALRNGPAALSSIPFFDTRTAADIGVPAFIGIDVNGTSVYAMGTGWLGFSLERCLCDLIELSNPRARACLCNVRGALDFRARVGGFLSRRLNFVTLGRNVVAASLSKKTLLLECAVSYCLDLSSKWKDNGNHNHGEVIWVDGCKQGREQGRDCELC